MAIENPSKARRMSKETLRTYRHHYTVGQLKEYLEKHNVPDDALIMVERVQDVYYNENNWSVYPKYSDQSYWFMEHNKRVDDGYYKDKENFPKEHPMHTRKFTQEEIESAMSEYTPVWSAVRYADDTDLLFLDLHY